MNQAVKFKYVRYLRYHHKQFVLNKIFFHILVVEVLLCSSAGG